MTGASYEDYMKVAARMPVVRYMTDVVLENVRATFDAEAERDEEESREKVARKVEAALVPLGGGGTV